MIIKLCGQLNVFCSNFFCLHSFSEMMMMMLKRRKKELVSSVALYYTQSMYWRWYSVLNVIAMPFTLQFEHVFLLLLLVCLSVIWLLYVCTRKHFNDVNIFVCICACLLTHSLLHSFAVRMCLCLYGYAIVSARTTKPIEKLFDISLCIDR